MTESLRIDRDWDLVLIGCGKAKQPAPARAVDLYTGPVFRAHLAIIRHLDEHWPHVLSAAHGVVCGGAELAPYDLQVGNGQHLVAGCPHCLKLDAEARRRGLSPKARASPQVELPARRERWNDHVLRFVLAVADDVLEGRGRCKLTVDREQEALPIRKRTDLYRWAFGPPREPAVLVLAGADYIDGWANRARAAGVRVDDPLRCYTLGERRSFAREFVATTPRWGAGDTPDKHGMTRCEQLLGLVAEHDEQRLLAAEDVESDVQQMALDFFAGGFYA